MKKMSIKLRPRRGMWYTRIRWHIGSVQKKFEDSYKDGSPFLANIGTKMVMLKND